MFCSALWLPSPVLTQTGDNKSFIISMMSNQINSFSSALTRPHLAIQLSWLLPPCKSCFLGFYDSSIVVYLLHLWSLLHNLLGPFHLLYMASKWYAWRPDPGNSSLTGLSLFSGGKYHLEYLLKCRVLGVLPKIFWLMGIGWDSRVCVLNKHHFWMNVGIFQNYSTVSSPGKKILFCSICNVF